MEYKSFIEDALDSAEKKYPCSDAGTALTNVLERARESTPGEAAEISPGAVTAVNEQKRRVFPAVAGIVGAAAVIAAGFFGFKYLYDNNITLLREGAGQVTSSDTTASVQDAPAVTLPPPLDYDSMNEEQKLAARLLNGLRWRMNTAEVELAASEYWDRTEPSGVNREDSDVLEECYNVLSYSDMEFYGGKAVLNLVVFDNAGLKTVEYMIRYDVSDDGAKQADEMYERIRSDIVSVLGEPADPRLNWWDFDESKLHFNVYKPDNWIVTVVVDDTSDLYSEITDNSMPEPYDTDYRTNEKFTALWVSRFSTDRDMIPQDKLEQYDEWQHELSETETPYAIYNSDNILRCMIVLGMEWEETKFLLIGNAALSDEDILILDDVMTLKDEESYDRFFEHFRSRYVIRSSNRSNATGGMMFTPMWLYYHTPGDYRTMGVSEKDVEAMIPVYASELGLREEAWGYFRDKLQKYVNSADIQSDESVTAQPVTDEASADELDTSMPDNPFSLPKIGSYEGLEHYALNYVFRFTCLDSRLTDLADKDEFAAWSAAYEQERLERGTGAEPRTVLAFVKKFGITKEQLLEVEKTMREDPMLEDISLSDEDISFIYSGDRMRCLSHFRSEYAVMGSIRAYSPMWLYQHTAAAYKAAGISQTSIAAMLPVYERIFTENDTARNMTDEAWAAFSSKLQGYIDDPAFAVTTAVAVEPPAETPATTTLDLLAPEPQTSDAVPAETTRLIETTADTTQPAETTSDDVVKANVIPTDDELKKIVEQGVEACGLEVTVNDLTRGSLRLNYLLHTGEELISVGEASDKSVDYADHLTFEWGSRYEIQVMNGGEWETYDPENMQRWNDEQMWPDGIHELGGFDHDTESETVLFYGNYMYESEIPDAKYRVKKNIAVYSAETGEHIGTLELYAEFVINEYTPNIFGISTLAKDVTPEGMTAEIHQSGEKLHVKRVLAYTPAYHIQRYTSEGWRSCEPLAAPSWIDTKYPINEDGVTERKFDWKWMYGSLPDGTYRISTDYVNYAADITGEVSEINRSRYYTEFVIGTGNLFGITLEATDVSSKSVTAAIKQSGGTIKDKLGYLSKWDIEKESPNGEWKKLEGNPTLWAPDIEPVAPESTTTRRFNLAEEYGELENGHYRISFSFIDYTPDPSAEFIDLQTVKENYTETLSFDFSITDSSANSWGIYLSAKDVSAEGMTLVIKQSGGSPSGELEYGSYYAVEKQKEGGWERCGYIFDNIAFTDIAYIVEKGQTREEKLNWSSMYGYLPAGHYRLVKDFDDYRGPGDRDEQTFYLEFDIPVNSSKLGISIYPKLYTSRGMTLEIVRDGGKVTDAAVFSEQDHIIEKKNGSKWERYIIRQAGVPTPESGRKIKNGEIQTLTINWRSTAGSLPEGEHRIGFTFTAGGISETIYAEFTVESYMTNIFGISVFTQEVSRTGGTFFLESRNGDYDGHVNYDRSFTLQKKNGGKWEYLTMTNGADPADSEKVSTLYVHSGTGYNGQSVDIDWKDIFGSLPNGKYRIGKTFRMKVGGETKQATVYAEFEITDDMP